jgi:hypothetical protein
MALAPASRLGAAPGPPRAPVAPTLSPEQLRGRHVSPGLQHPPSGSEQLRSCHVSRGWALQAASKYVPRHYATRAASHVRKACSRRPIKYRRDVWQAGHSGLSQCRVVQQLWATERLQPGVSAVGHLSATATGLVTQRHSTVPMIECRVACDKTCRAHVIEDISMRQDMSCPRH